MNTRRAFVKLTAFVGLLSVVGGRAAPAAAAPAADASPGTGADDRARWCALASRLATPVLTALAERRLKATMPIEAAPRITDRAHFTYLEVLGRLLCGLAPWLELGGDDS